MKVVFFVFILSSISFLQAQTLKVNTKITLGVNGVPEVETERISGLYTIDGKGFINLPLLNNTPIKASSCTAAQLERKIAIAYKNAGIYASPVFVVSSSQDEEIEFQEKAKKKVFLKGYVKAAGAVDFIPGMTIEDLLNHTGGANADGSKRRFRLIRAGKTTEYNFHKTPEFMNIKLQAKDAIEIPAWSVWKR